MYTTHEARRLVEMCGNWYAFDVISCHQGVISTLWRLWIVSRVRKYEAKQNGTYVGPVQRFLDALL